MQLAVQVDVLQDFGAICLEGGAEVAQVHARSLRHEPVRDARRNFSRDGIVQTSLAPSARDVVPLVDLREESRYIFGLVLQIAVERDDDFTLGLVEPGRQSGSLAEVAAQADHLQPRIRFREIGEEFEAAVRGSIVHKQYLVLPLHSLQHTSEPVVKRQKRRLLVVNGNNDGDHNAAFSVAGFKASAAARRGSTLSRTISPAMKNASSERIATL